MVIARVDYLKEVCRRKLFIVADYYDLVCARDYPQCVLGRDLTSLVNHQEIEFDPSGWEELRDGERAHKQDRFQLLDSYSGIGHQLANRAMFAFLIYLGS